MTDEMHDFLLDEHGELCRGARKIPEIRDYISSLPETSATFAPRLVDAYEYPVVEPIHLEFAGAWPAPHPVDRGSYDRFINPNHVHAHKYPDVIGECPCGAFLTRNYEDGLSILDEHDHADGCMPFDRLRARANLSEKRYLIMLRTGRLGWTRDQMAPRLGMHYSPLSGLARDYGIRISNLREEYRVTASNTYKYLVDEVGEQHGDVADIYGHTQTTMTRWAKDRADYIPVGGKTCY